MTSPPGTSSCATLLRDVSRKLTHEVNNAANGVAVNLEVVRSRAEGSEALNATGAFARRASEQLETLTALHEILRTLLQLTIDSIEENRLSCGLSTSGDEFEITFTGSVIPRVLRARRDGGAAISMRNSRHGVILSVPRNSPSSE